METKPSGFEEDSRPQGASTTIIRFIGAAILLAGLFSGYQVIARAWQLFESQDTVVRFADEIDKHAHLNAFVAQLGVVVEFVNKAKNALPENQGQTAAPPVPVPAAPRTAVPPTTPAPPLNASYFMAWLFTLILLGLIAKISMWAIAAGGKLALFAVDNDRQLRYILRELIQELKARQL